MAGYMSSVSNAPGSNQDPGAFGNNTYQVSQYNVDQNAFTNPAGNGAAQYNQGVNSIIPTTVNNVAPQLGPTATSTGGGVTGLNNVANQYMNIANGTGPSLAGQTAQLATNQAQQNNLSALGSARGVANPALANYMAGQQNAATQQANTATAVQGKTAEQLGALGAAGGAYGQLTQNQQFNAQQVNQQATQQAQLEAQQRGLNAQQTDQYVTFRAQQLANSMQAAQAGQQLQVQNNLGTQQIQANAFDAAANHSIGGQAIGAISSIAGAAAGALVHSDQRLKKNIKPGKQQIEKFLSFLAGA